MGAIADDYWTTMWETDRQAIESIENAFLCCGYYNNSDRAVPPRYDGDPMLCNITLGYQAPCQLEVLTSVENSLVAAGGTAIAIAVVQVICLIFSCYLFVKIPRHRDDDVLLDR